MLNLAFNAVGIMLTATAVYGAMDGQIVSPIGFAFAAITVALIANFVEAQVFEGRRDDVDRHARSNGVVSNRLSAMGRHPAIPLTGRPSGRLFFGGTTPDYFFAMIEPRARRQVLIKALPAPRGRQFLPRPAPVSAGAFSSGPSGNVEWARNFFANESNLAPIWRH